MFIIHSVQDVSSSSSGCSSSLPIWLDRLMREPFFTPCSMHEEVKKNEKNVFCLDCCISFCPHCSSSHPSHRLLQIRRYVYNDVIRLSDAQKLMNCDYVQAYTNNSAKVVFLNQRPVTRGCKGAGSFCHTCERSLQQPYLYCCLACKVDHIITAEGVDALAGYLKKCKFMQLPERGSELDAGQMTPNSVLEPAEASLMTMTSSGSSGDNAVSCANLVSTSTTEFAIIRKKRSRLKPNENVCRPAVFEISSSFMNRRKGTPQRSPLY